MTMGEVTAPHPAFDSDDLIFMGEERSLKDLTTPSTSSGENSRLNSSDSSDIYTGCYQSIKRPRIEETQSTSGFDYLFDGLDLPTSVVRVPTHNAEDEDTSIEADSEKEDCHDFYGEIKWCDEILEKFEAQLEREKDEEQDATINEAIKLVEEHDQEQERERIMKKTSRDKHKNKMKLLSQASKETTLFCCFICHKGFVSEDHVQQHVNNVHLREDKRYPYKCKKCHMRFAHMPNLYRHQATHSGTMFKCNQCPYEFKAQDTLDIHVAREHAKKDQEEVEQVECGICRKDFNSEAELKRHSWYCKNKEDIALKRKQAKEAKLGVNAVSPALSTGSMSSVSTGASTGSGGRPIKDKTCPYCLDPFASMQSRNRHIANKHPEKKNDVETTTVQYFKIDSPDLPYACLICSKRFATSSSLNTHKKRIHEKKLDHVCGQCGKAYPLGSELRKHLRRTHNVTEVEAQDMTSF